jgi:ATP-binding cassette subfamily B protein
MMGGGFGGGMGGFRGPGGGGPGRGGMGIGMMARSDLLLDEEEFGKPFDWGLAKRFGVYLAPYRGRLFIAIVMTLLYTLTSLANPYLIGLAIDRFITVGDFAGLTVLCGIYVLNNILLWQSQYRQVYQMNWVGQFVLYKLASDLFWHLQKLQISFYDRNELGRIMARVQNDVSVLQNILSQGLLSILANLIILIGIVISLLTLNTRLALVTFIVLPVMFVVVYFWQQRAQRSFRQVRAAISVVNASLQENVSGVRVIQSLSRERVNMRQFSRVNNENLEANLTAGRLAALLMPIIELTAAMATAAVIVYGGSLVLGGELQVGALVAFTLYITRFFDPIRDLSQQYTNMQRATIAAERIFEILDTAPELVDRPDATELPKIEGRVTFDHVSFSYVDGVPVLRDFDLDVRPGETIALVGPTGAGKSTIISLLARFYDVREGRLLVDGHDVRDVTMRSLRGQLGMVLQDPFLFSGTVAENIRYGRLDATRAEIEEAARLVGAHDLIARLPKGYETEIHERGNNLSMGQRQLISFARTLLADPRILILDEATANIDSHTELIIQRGLRRLLAGRTAFIIAHRLSTIKRADRIVVLEQGRVRELGTHDELIAREGLYYTLYSMGFQQVAAPSQNGRAQEEVRLART